MAPLVIHQQVNNQLFCNSDFIILLICIDGMDYSNSCPCGVTEAFWAQFSIQFASVASDTVFYLVNGEREGGVFQPSSNFAEYELPQLSPSCVSEVVIMVAHRKGQGKL